MANATDTFAGTGALSANWTNMAGTASRVTGVVTPSVAPALYRWNATVFQPTQYVELTLAAAPTSQIAVFARLDASVNGYLVRADSSGGLDSLRSTGGVGTVLEALTGYTFIAGDTIGIKITGSLVRIYYNGVAQGAGATDATYAGPGTGGFGLSAVGDTISHWLVQDSTLATAASTSIATIVATAQHWSLIPLGPVSGQATIVATLVKKGHPAVTATAAGHATVTATAKNKTLSVSVAATAAVTVAAQRQTTLALFWPVTGAATVTVTGAVHPKVGINASAAGFAVVDATINGIFNSPPVGGVFRAIEIWTDCECASGRRVAEFPPQMLASAVLTQSLTATEELVFTTSRVYAGSAELLAGRIARLCWTDARLDTEWRIVGDINQSGTGDQGQLQITAQSLLLDLARAPYLTFDAIGNPSWDFAAVQLTAAQHITGFVLPACTEANLFPLDVGQMDFPNAFDLTGSYVTALQILKSILAVGNAPGECYLSKNGATNYLINIVTARGATANVVQVLASKNLLANQRTRLLTQVGTKLMPRGDSTAIVRDMGHAYWTVAGVVSATVAQLADPLGGAGPIAFTGQLNGLYVARLVTTFSSQVVTASDAATQQITVASTAGWTAGDRVEFRRAATATGARVASVQHPLYSLAAANGGYGARTLILDIPGLVGDSNLVPNPWARQWSNPSNPPDGWSSFQGGGSSFARDTVNTRYGGASYQFVLGVGIPTVWIVSPTLFPFATVGLLHSAHCVFMVTDATPPSPSYPFRLHIKDPTLATTYFSSTNLFVTLAQTWLTLALTSIDLSAVATGVVLVLECASGIDRSFTVDTFSLAENAAGADIAEEEASGGTALWQAANVRLGQLASPIANYVTSIADLARVDGGAWTDEPLVLGGDIQIVDPDIPDTVVERITDVQQDLLNPLASTVQLANANPQITLLLAAVPAGT